MVDGFRMTLRLHEYVEKESFNHPYTFWRHRPALDEDGARHLQRPRRVPGRWHRFETPASTGIDELYLNKRYRCILTNIEANLLDLLATRRRGRGDQLPDEAERPAEGRDRQHGHVEPLPGSGQRLCPRPVSWSISSMWCAWPNDALERVRKGLRKELKPSQSRTLKGDRKILLKRAHEVSDRERLIMETRTGAFPQLLAAYEHKERFYGIWDATRLQAEAARTSG